MMAESASPPAAFNRNGQRKTHLGRSDSLMSLARAPFSVQLHRLTSLSLPTPDSLHTRILDAENSSESLARLRNIATDVHKWINTASTVLSQLDADDDVEWAARGKDSLAKVENAAKRFGEIVEMFLDTATALSERSDDTVKEEIKELISIMDEVTHGWSGVRDLLQGLKEQVALSTEWMEIREILDDISSELEACSNMVFELEESRHLNLVSNDVSTTSSSASSPSSATELDRLTSILENQNSPAANPHRTSLLRLSARIQPLRASLDFLKPRLSSFTTRAATTFPTALSEVVQRKGELEKRWAQVERDWRSIGRELQEDEWVEVFRSVGKQATDMMSSIRRSMDRLDTFLPDSSPPFDLIENYIAKKTYYPPAINRVLGVLDRGYKHRATFNGEIGRNYDDLLDRWNEMQAEMRRLDNSLRDLGVHDTVATISRQTKQISINTDARPRSAGSTSSNTTLTQGGPSPTDPTSSRGSSIRSGNRVTSLPPTRRDSYLTPDTQRNRSVSTNSTTTTSRINRLHLPFFSPRSRVPLPPRPSTSLGTGTGGLIPIQARPRWNASPKANVLGSPPTKIPAVVITPSRIPRTGRATPTQHTPTTTPLRPVSRMSPPSSTPRSLMPAPMSRAVSNPNSIPRVSETPPVPKIPEPKSRRLTANFSNIKAKTAIPRPATAQGMNGRSVSGPAGQAAPRWRG